jgi:hypothetical protein
MYLLGGLALVGRPQVFAAIVTGPDVDADAGAAATAAGTRSADAHRAAAAKTFLACAMNPPTKR